MCLELQPPGAAGGWLCAWRQPGAVRPSAVRKPLRSVRAPSPRGRPRSRFLRVPGARQAGIASWSLSWIASVLAAALAARTSCSSAMPPWLRDLLRVPCDHQSGASGQRAADRRPFASKFSKDAPLTATPRGFEGPIRNSAERRFRETPRPEGTTRNSARKRTVRHRRCDVRPPVTPRGPPSGSSVAPAAEPLASSSASVAGPGAGCSRSGANIGLVPSKVRSPPMGGIGSGMRSSSSPHPIELTGAHRTECSPAFTRDTCRRRSSRGARFRGSATS